MRLKLNTRAMSAAAALLMGLSLAAGLATAAQAADPAAAAATDTRRECFFMSDWNGWHAADTKTLYINIRMHELWRIDLDHECGMLTSPSAHLVTKMHGVSTVCNRMDLDLSVEDTQGFAEPCFIKSIHRLTPAEAAAVDKKNRP